MNGYIFQLQVTTGHEVCTGERQEGNSRNGLLKAMKLICTMLPRQTHATDHLCRACAEWNLKHELRPADNDAPVGSTVTKVPHCLWRGGGGQPCTDRGRVFQEQGVCGATVCSAHPMKPKTCLRSEVDYYYNYYYYYLF